MAATLVEWQRHAGELMAEVSTQIASFKRQQDDARKAQRELDDKVEAVRATLRENASAEGGFGVSMDPDARMDFDDDMKLRKGPQLKGRRGVSGRR